MGEIKLNGLISKKHKKTFINLNFTEHLVIFTSIVTGCVSISAFASLVAILVGIASFAVGLKICVITAGIKRYKSVMKKKEEAWWNRIDRKI